MFAMRKETLVTVPATTFFTPILAHLVLTSDYYYWLFGRGLLRGFHHGLSLGLYWTAIFLGRKCLSATECEGLSWHHP